MCSDVIFAKATSKNLLEALRKTYYLCQALRDIQIQQRAGILKRFTSISDVTLKNFAVRPDPDPDVGV